ncbi:tRNA intron endonuclease, catalytic carboxy-terminal domain protein [Toxoplasma gondii RUB]|uniref:tRNA-intron lyase n=1 Tax=Toxoplasma gondii RUB TaxID=935652 RepID=A0A086LLS2_TOXGO|nr:tRNA intron endonuclease, catalytic carboxy-terminal domain protein [Toxoplasma gondii RUB]
MAAEKDFVDKMTRKENALFTLDQEPEFAPFGPSREEAPRPPFPVGLDGTHLATRGYGGFVCAQCLRFFVPEGESGTEVLLESPDNDDARKEGHSSSQDPSPVNLAQSRNPIVLPSSESEFNMSLLFYSRRLRDALETHRLLAIQLKPLVEKTRKRPRLQQGGGCDGQHRLGPDGRRKTNIFELEREIFLLSASQSRVLLDGKVERQSHTCSGHRDAANSGADLTASEQKYNCLVSGKEVGAWLTQPGRVCPWKCSSEALPVFVLSLPALNPSPIISMGGSSVRVRKAEAARSRVFLDLHRRGFFVRDGLAYGGDWLLYPLSPSLCHAAALVFVVVAPEKRCNSQECMRCSRSNRGRFLRRLNSPDSCPSRMLLDTATEHNPVLHRSVDTAEDPRATDVFRPLEECQKTLEFSALYPVSLVRMHRLATAAKKAAVLALVELESREPPLYIQLDRVKEED